MEEKRKRGRPPKLADPGLAPSKGRPPLVGMRQVLKLPIEERRDEVQAKMRARARALLAGVEPDDLPPTPHETEDPISLDLSETMAGVTATWLSRAFKIELIKTKSKLVPCPHIKIGRGGTKLYDLSQAAQYLVKPKLEGVAALSAMKPGDLPPHLKPAIWGARIKQQEWELNAGQLWMTKDVLDVLTDVFSTIRTTIQLWVDTLEKTGLSEAHRMILSDLTDSLQDDLHKKLIDLPNKKKTRSQLKELEEEYAPSELEEIESETEDA